VLFIDSLKNPVLKVSLKIKPTLPLVVFDFILRLTTRFYQRNSAFKSTLDFKVKTKITNVQAFTIIIFILFKNIIFLKGPLTKKNRV